MMTYKRRLSGNFKPLKKPIKVLRFSDLKLKNRNTIWQRILRFFGL